MLVMARNSLVSEGFRTDPLDMSRVLLLISHSHPVPDTQCHVKAYITPPAPLPQL